MGVSQLPLPIAPPHAGTSRLWVFHVLVLVLVLVLLSLLGSQYDGQYIPASGLGCESSRDVATDAREAHSSTSLRASTIIANFSCHTLTLSIVLMFTLRMRPTVGASSVEIRVPTPWIDSQVAAVI